MAVLIAVYQSTPGYMDADYYFGGGLQLVTGHGFTEPFIWNFLNDPTGLPRVSYRVVEVTIVVRRAPSWRIISN